MVKIPKLLIPKIGRGRQSGARSGTVAQPSSIVSDGEFASNKQMVELERQLEVHQRRISSPSNSPDFETAREWLNTLTDRRFAIRATLALSDNDRDFKALVRDADNLRDIGKWDEAAEVYRKALIMFPLHAGYWVQYGHCCKEQSLFIEAELAYRNAYALGAVDSDTFSHLSYVADLNGGYQRDNLNAVRSFWRTGVAPIVQSPPPIVSDIEISIFSFLHRWPSNSETIRTLDVCSSLDAVLAYVITKDEFYFKNRELLELLREVGFAGTDGV